MSEGQMIIGNYELHNCVAAGSTTQIWEVTQAGSPMQLAMKLMLDDARMIPAEKNVLKHEFKIGKMMDHPSFLRFHELEINRDHAFFIMDFFRSPSLKNHITSNRAAIQSTFKKLAESLALAFQFMHETGWLHRDIKPDNILVNKAGEARVIDFSLSSKVLGGLGKLIAGKQKVIQGTRTYIAPETILKKPPTPQTDMYSLGVTFFEVLTGQPPFAGDSPNALLKKHLGETPVGPSAINQNVTKELDRVVLRMLEKNPLKRFESMQELAGALRSIKCFDADPLELFMKQAADKKTNDADSVDKRLDSRADAVRTLNGIAAPAAPKNKRRVSEKLLREEEARLAAIAAKKNGGAPPGQNAQMPGMMQPNMMPQMPGMMYPGMQMPPGYGQPGMPPGMMPPGMPMPAGYGQPGMPMQPGAPMPPQYTQQAPVPQAPPAPAQQQPAQPVQQQPAPVQPVPQPPVQQQPVPPASQPPEPQQPVQPAQQPASAADQEEVTTEDLMDLMSQFKIE
ncbi:MAG: serine/threonine-protein kinase [Fuerstiella sp.]